MPRHPRFGSRKRGEEGGEREVRKRRSGGPLTGASGNNGEGTVKSGKKRERKRGKLETTKIPRVLPQSRPRFMNFTLPLLCDYCKKGHRGAGATFSPRARSTFELARSRREDEILNSLSPLAAHASFRTRAILAGPRPLPGSQLRKVPGNEREKKVDAVSVPSCYFLVQRGTRHTRAANRAAARHALSLLAHEFFTMLLDKCRLVFR